MDLLPDCQKKQHAGEATATDCLRDLSLRDDQVVTSGGDAVLQLDEINELLNDEPIGRIFRSGQASTASPLHQKSKAKRGERFRAYSVSEEGKFGSARPAIEVAGPKVSRASKNLRRTKSGVDRGLPKKGGAGGKGTWGQFGCELELMPWLDPDDPNYEPESVELRSLVPKMSEPDVIASLQPMMREYFEHGDTCEVLKSLEELFPNLGSWRWLIVSVLIQLAMDHKPSHCEMASTLISDLYHRVISESDIATAFDYLLAQLPDLVLDTPEAAHILGNFMARAVADECIPVKFLHSYKGKVKNEEAKEALLKATTMLNMKHGLVRLDNVWGVGGGIRPVKYLIKKIILLLKEYLSCGDLKEAARCLLDLEVPHFHHELVYEAVIMVIEASDEHTPSAICLLLQSLFRSFIITIDQLRNGFQRVYDMMPELAIDVPAAYTILEAFVQRCRAMGIIDEHLVSKMPSRAGRRRFVSEGDALRHPSNW